MCAPRLCMRHKFLRLLAARRLFSLKISFILALSQLFSRTICMRICRCLFAQNFAPSVCSARPAHLSVPAGRPTICYPPASCACLLLHDCHLPVACRISTLSAVFPRTRPAHPVSALHGRLPGLVQFFFHFLCAVNNFCSVYFFRVERRRRRCFFQTLIVVACPLAHSSTASSSSSLPSLSFFSLAHSPIIIAVLIAVTFAVAHVVVFLA